MLPRRMVAVLLLAPWIAGPVAGQTWESKLELGLALNDGTSDTLDVNVALASIRETDLDRLGLLLRGAYGEADDDETSQKVLGEARYNRDITRLYYWNLLGSIEHDKFRDINIRTQTGPGLGVHVVRNDPTFLDLEAGIVYIHTDFDGSDSEDQIHWRFADVFRTEFSETTSFKQLLEWLPQFDDFGEYLLRFESVLSVAMTEAMSLNLRLVDDYDSDPPEELEKNNLALYATLGWTF